MDKANEEGMTAKDKSIMAVILLVIVVLVVLDLFSDSKEGVTWWHAMAEGSAALVAAFGLVRLLADSFKTKHSLESEKKISSEYKVQAEKWKIEAKKYIEGLSLAIDDQLNAWKLSASEKEVAFLLLKGLSSKEIAEIRNTTEKTARAQSMSIYAKAGLAGRSELAAFFLEDLLAPKEKSKDE